MKFKWNLDVKDYEKFVKTKAPRTEVDEMYPDDCIGTIQVGNLMFDIMDHDECLRLDLYVTDVESGYGYYYQDELPEEIPYDFCYRFDMAIYRNYFTFDSFKRNVEKRIRKKLQKMKTYQANLTTGVGIEVDLLKEANASGDKIVKW